MRVKVRHFVLYFMFTALFAGCATVPVVQDSQPWRRIISSQETIRPGAKIKIEVSGLALPILGKEDLAFKQIQAILTDLLIRRGFYIDLADYEYAIKLNYKTERNDKLRMSSFYSAANYDFDNSYTASAAGSYAGLGVSLARVVSQRTTGAVTNAGFALDQSPSYTHTLSAVIMNRTGIDIWKGDTTWDEPNLNIMSNIVPVLQMILSSLPADQNVKPEVGKLRKSHVQNFFNVKCLEQRWLTCPALPFRIYLSRASSPGGMPDLKLPFGLHDEYALAAYVDLLQTAEYALPNGDEEDWINPININLWRKVTLGGQYLIGPNKLPINVLVKLSGEEKGYYIDSAAVVSDHEYSNFQQKLSNWKNAVKNFRDFFELKK